MNRAALAALDLLFPNTCGCCGARIRYDALVCETCRSALDSQRAAYGAWRDGHDGEEFPWEDGAAVFSYGGAAKAGILALKDGVRNFGQYAGLLLAEEVRNCFPGAAFSCIAPVPVSRRRRRKQGCAHAEIIARNAAKQLGIPLRCGLLTERHGGERQHMLSGAERLRNTDRFAHTGTDLAGQTVLLVDDVLTTGTTMRICTALLLECGAERVYAAAAAVRLKDAPKT